MRDHSRQQSRPAGVGARVLGLFLCVRLTLTYLRHNLPQELLAEVYGVSQSTASRLVTAYTPLLAHALGSGVPTVEDLDPTAQPIVDGTLLECWSWKSRPELDLRQAQDHRTQRAGRLHPGRDPGLGVRPPGRTHSRCRGAAPLRPAQYPRHRPPAWSRPSFTYRRRRLHRGRHRYQGPGQEPAPRPRHQMARAG